MTYAQIKAAWTEAQTAGPAFYSKFEAATGLSQETVTTLFGRWNRLSFAETEGIAARHGTTLREGGFQAYLAEVYSSANSGCSQ